MNEFDYTQHKLVCSGHAGDLLLEVYDIEGRFHWELVDQYGRVHASDDVDTVKKALLDGSNQAGAEIELIQDEDDELGE
jgi:hypothetical protein